MDPRTSPPPPPPPSPDDAVDWLERIELQQRGLDAARLRLIASAVEQVTEMPATVSAPGSGIEREHAYRSLRAELALALNLGERQIEAQMGLACELVQAYPAALEALEQGIISREHARVVIEAGRVIGAGDAPDAAQRRRRYESAALEFAVRETPNRLRPIAQRLAEHWSERTIDERQRLATCRRRVIVIERADGMADLLAHLPALEAYAIHDRLTRIAHATERGERTVRPRSSDGGDIDQNGIDQRNPAPSRTRDQLRADVLAELLLAADEGSLFASSAAEAIRGRVQVQMSVRTDADVGASVSADQIIERCELAGFGPISAESAGRIAVATPSWSAVIAGTSSSETLRVDRYRPSEEMRRVLGARDQHCRFPGCRMPAHRCDLDHTIDAALGGATSMDNLAHLCRGHHTLKHHSRWRVSQGRAGRLRWVSPAGRSYIDHPSGLRDWQETASPRRSREVRFAPF